MSLRRALWERVPAPVVDIALVAVAAGDVWLSMWDHTALGVTLATLGCAALVFRRRFPLGVFLLTLPIALTQPVALAPLVTLFTLAERSRSRPLLAGCVALTAVASSAPWPLTGFAEVGRTMTLIDFVYSLATAVAPVLFGQLLQTHRDLARRLAEIEEAREHERALHAQAVLARERAQLAREMHDVVSHQVSLIAVQAGAMQIAAQDANAKEAARTIRSLSVTTLDELRTMVTLLRASGGQATELTPQPTLADLHTGPPRITARFGRPAGTGRHPARHAGDRPDHGRRLPGASADSPQRGLTDPSGHSASTARTTPRTPGCFWASRWAIWCA